MQRVLELQRKTLFVANVTSLLQALNLPSTAQRLQQEAAVQQPTPHQLAELIVNDPAYSQLQKNQALTSLFRRELSKLIASGQLDEALSLYQQVIPKYFADLEPFSELFAASNSTPSQSRSPQSLATLSQKIVSSLSVPENRLSCQNITEQQIWFLKAWKGYILLVDKAATAFLVKGGEVIKERRALHSTTLVGMEIGEEMFVTSGIDGVCRLWDQQLKLVFEFHAKGRATGVCWSRSRSELYVCVSGGGGMRVRGLPEKPQFQEWQLSNLAARSCVFLDRKKRLLVGCSVNGEGKIISLNPVRGTFKTVLTKTATIHTVQLSLDQSMLFLNHSPSAITIYSTSHYHPLHTFIGFTQRHSLMRMSQAPHTPNLLAVSSQDGTVLIYDLQLRQLCYTLRGKGGPVNCLDWLQSDLFFGCDNGILEQWSNQGAISRQTTKIRMPTNQDSQMDVEDHLQPMNDS